MALLTPEELHLAMHGLRVAAEPFIMLTRDCSNARLRGATSKATPSKSPISAASDDGRLNSPGGLSQKSSSSLNLSSKHQPPPASPSLSQTVVSAGASDDDLSSYHLPKPLPLWINPAYAKHIVKGNFMTLSRRPKTVDDGEWIAHQGTL